MRAARDRRDGRGRDLDLTVDGVDDPRDPGHVEVAAGRLFGILARPGRPRPPPRRRGLPQRRRRAPHRAQPDLGRHRPPLGGARAWRRCVSTSRGSATPTGTTSAIATSPSSMSATSSATRSARAIDALVNRGHGPAHRARRAVRRRVLGVPRRRRRRARDRRAAAQPGRPRLASAAGRGPPGRPTASAPPGPRVADDPPWRRAAGPHADDRRRGPSPDRPVDGRRAGARDPPSAGTAEARCRRRRRPILDRLGAAGTTVVMAFSADEPLYARARARRLPRPRPPLARPADRATARPRPHPPADRRPASGERPARP